MKLLTDRIKIWAGLYFLLTITSSVFSQSPFTSNLPIVVINTNGVPIPDEPKINGQMGIIYNGPGASNSLDDPFNDFDGMIGIEIRGQSSQQFPKKSYGFETRDAAGEDVNVSLLGLPKENDWVLYAPYSDKSMLRNVVSFEIARKMGEYYASRSMFCEVFLNNDYIGVYTLMEKIKPDKNRVSIEKLDPDDVSGDSLTGGYILAVDKIPWDFTFGADGWRSVPATPYPNAMHIIFQYYYPEPDEIMLAQRSYIKGFITEAENALSGYTFNFPEIGYYQYFDVLSFVDAMLWCEISKEVDKYRYSTYFYKERDSDGGKLFAGPPWDFDLGYGNVNYWAPGLDHTGWLYAMVEPVEWGIMFWWKRLMEDPYFKNLARTRWSYLREHQLGDLEVHMMIDSILHHIDEAKDRNYERWPILGTWVWPNYDWEGNDYEDEVDYFETFLTRRLAWMDANMTGTVIHPEAGISAEKNLITLRLYNINLNRRILKPGQFTLNNAPPGAFIQEVQYKYLNQCEITVNTDVSGYPDLTVTIADKATDYWEDITSSPLSSAGIGDQQDLLPLVTVFEENQRLHIRCGEPERMPEEGSVFNLAGQKLFTFRLQQATENIIPVHLAPGIYLVQMHSGKEAIALKLTVVN